jgi:sugar phosphate isomerase/epimerase
MSVIPVALQLYTVRDELAKDFVGTIEQVAEIGYKSVELAGTDNLTAGELKALLDRVDVTTVGPHTSLTQLAQDLDRVLDYFAEVGCPYITCPYMPEEYRPPEEFSATCELLNRIGEGCRERGFQFCYHNHAFEFETMVGDQMLFDALYDKTDPELVKGEVDIYWVQYAGYNPAEVIARRPERFPLIHLKDMTPGEPTFAEVGEGILDLPSVFTASESSGAAWYIVEQDRCQRPSLQSARISFDNLHRMGKV